MLLLYKRFTICGLKRAQWPSKGVFSGDKDLYDMIIHSCM